LTHRILVALGRVALGVVIAVAIWIAFAAVMRLQHVALPAPTGPSAVGRTELALTDQSRVDPFESDGRKRELAVWIWYPAPVLARATASTAPYLPAAWASMLGDLPLSQDLTAVSTNSLAGVPMNGRPPVVVLQPGLGLPVASYTTLAEDLASHGYAVVGINETGSAPAVFPDGHAVPATPKGNVAAPNVDGWYADAKRVTDVWVADAQFVVKQLAASPPEIGALDFSHVAYAGHSLGGASAFEACSQDPSCSAAVDLDGTLWTDVRHTGLDAPRLLLQHAPPDSCDEFCSRAATDFAKVMASGDAARYSVTGAVHSNFSDAGLMFGIANGLLLGPIDGQRMTAIMRDTVRPFVDIHVLGASSDEFEAAVAKYPELVPVNP
jgi:predicted dienelactone hydrolase